MFKSLEKIIKKNRQKNKTAKTLLLEKSSIKENEKAPKPKAQKESHSKHSHISLISFDFGRKIKN